jgi:biopolymer transport protein ExbD
MAPSTRRHPAAIAEINVTPMCDVMIVLLVIFMVVTPMMDEVPGLELPAARTADPLEEREGSVILIRADGQLQMGNEVFASPGELMIRLQARLEQATGAAPVLRVKAHRDLRYGQVSAVLAACRAAGADRVALVANQEPGG